MKAAVLANTTKKSPLAYLTECLKTLIGQGCERLRIKEINPEELRQESYSIVQKKVSDAIEMSVLSTLPASHVRAARVHDAFVVNSEARKILSRDIASNTVAKIAVEDLGKFSVFRTNELSKESAKIIAQELSAHVDRINGILENPADTHKTKALQAANNSFLKSLAEHGLRLCINHKEGFLIRLTEGEKLEKI